MYAVTYNWTINDSHSVKTC